MKMHDFAVLIDSYNLVCQNPSGGIKIRIENYVEQINKKIKVKLFDKWKDKVIDFQVVHIFKSSSESYTLLKYCKANHIPVVVSSVVPAEKRFAILMCHLIGTVLPVYPDRYLNELVLKGADAICAQTEKEKDFICNTYKISSDKIFVIPNGVSLNEFTYSGDYFYEKTGIKDGFVLQVGRFDSNKNQLNVIRALKDTDIPVVFIGGADKNDPDYFSLCKNEANENMHFLGWVEHNDPLLQAAYHSAHTVILPSHKEIFGNSLMEGGFCGANLIASKALPIEEWGLDQYCRKVDASDVRDIREVIIEAQKTDKSFEVSNFIKNTFSWDAVTDQYIDVYRKVIKCNAGDIHCE